MSCPIELVNWVRPLCSLRHERGIDITNEAVQFWRGRLGTIVATEIGRSWGRAMLRFQRMRSLQKFAVLLGSIYNHFNAERTLISRQKLSPLTRGSRTVALALSPSGANSALFDPCWGRGLSEIMLVRLTSSQIAAGHEI